MDLDNDEYGVLGLIREVNALNEHEHYQRAVDEIHRKCELPLGSISKLMPIKFKIGIIHFSTSEEDAHVIYKQGTKAVDEYFEEYIKEYTILLRDEDTEDPPSCVCSHVITDLYYMKNAKNGNIILSGNECIDKFIKDEVIKKIKHEELSMIKLKRRKCKGCSKLHDVSLLRSNYCNGCKSMRPDALKRACIKCYKFKVNDNLPFWVEFCKGCHDDLRHICWNASCKYDTCEICMRNHLKACNVCNSYELEKDEEATICAQCMAATKKCVGPDCTNRIDVGLITCGRCKYGKCQEYGCKKIIDTVMCEEHIKLYQTTRKCRGETCDRRIPNEEDKELCGRCFHVNCRILFCKNIAHSELHYGICDFHHEQFEFECEKKKPSCTKLHRNLVASKAPIRDNSGKKCLDCKRPIARESWFVRCKTCYCNQRRENKSNCVTNFENDTGDLTKYLTLSD